jgi:hypothetical protein
MNILYQFVGLTIIDINRSFSIYLSRKQLNMSGRGKGGKGLGNNLSVTDNTSPGKTTDGWLINTLDIITQHFPVSVCSSFSKTRTFDK